MPDPLSTRHMSARDWLREAGMLALRMAVGLYVLNLGYGFEGSLKKLGEFHFVSDLFTGQDNDSPPFQGGAGGGSSGNEHPASKIQHPRSINRFAHTWLGELPVPFPKNYLLGIDIQQHDFEDYGRPSYLRGQWRDRGWWYYYLYAAAIKVPLGLWLLGAWVAVLRVGDWPGTIAAMVVRRLQSKLRLSPSRGPAAIEEQHVPVPLSRFRHSGFPSCPHTETSGSRCFSFWLKANSQQLTTSFRDELMLLFPAAVIFAVVSAKTGFSEHMRYILPVYPFLFVWVAQIATCFADRGLAQFAKSAE